MITSTFSGLYRRRSVILGLAILLILSGTLASALLPRGDVRSLMALLPLAGCCLMLVSLLAIMVAAAQRREDPPAVIVASPVVGRWLGMNSPASKVPSHGVRAYGQAHAIDLVYEPSHAVRPQFGSGASMRPPQDYPAFGEPVLAMLDGTVVAASDGQRDHRSRSRWLAVIYLLGEASMRELGGPRLIVGNHVTIRSDDGTFTLVAHLRQGSVRVRVGDKVRAGQQLAECGNSGNSSEPHVHAQLMDRASLWTAQGLPMVFEGVRISTESGAPNVEPANALPANGEHMLATPQPKLTRAKTRD